MPLFSLIIVGGLYLITDVSELSSTGQLLFFLSWLEKFNFLGLVISAIWSVFAHWNSSSSEDWPMVVVSVGGFLIAVFASRMMLIHVNVETGIIDPVKFGIAFGFYFFSVMLIWLLSFRHTST